MQIFDTKEITIWANSLVNVTLQDCRCICELKGQKNAFRGVISSSYYRFPYVFILYLNQTIGILDIDFGDVLHLGQLD
jgi:hypothetical protein